MKKAAWLCASMMLLVTLCRAQDRDMSKVEIKVHKVSGAVYMLEGAGGNIGVSTGEDGIVIIDDQFAPLADKIRAALKGISDKPVRFVINTHYHGDHTGGNQPFAQTSTVIAQDNVRKRLITGGKGGNGGTQQFDAKPAASPAALPIITFDHDVTVHLNGEDIRALHIPAGHTDGDSVIFFPKSNVVHMGDDFVTYGFPFVDIQAGGSVKGMIAGVEQVMSQLPPDVKVIPGHGPISNLDDVRTYVTMLKDTTAVIHKAMQQGQTLEQMKQAKLMEPWKKYSGDFITADQWIETVYYDTKSEKKGEFHQH